MSSSDAEEQKKMNEELFKGEEIIKKQINKSNKIENEFENFVIFLTDPKNENVNKNLFKYNEIHPKDDERDYTYLNPNYDFSFPSNFVFATKTFMNLISEEFNYLEKENVKTNLFPIIIGGECIIMRNFGDIKGDKGYSYIIIYDEKQIGQNIDFILIIDDKNEREKAQNFILKYNIWNYFKKIKFSIDEDNK